MSHTSRFKDDEGREWVVIHNGDWSGDATLRCLKSGEEHVIPGSIIKQACAQAVAEEIVSMLEQKFL